MVKVRAKKHLGQHFLKDLDIASKIVDSLLSEPSTNTILEIGPGTGVLTQFLVPKKNIQLNLVEVDTESIKWLRTQYSPDDFNLIEEDFLKLDIDGLSNNPIALIGNLPYNISSQIFFKALEHKEKIKEMVFMVQKEVGKRIASPPGNKNYGILSVLLQAFYDIVYLMDVPPHVFEPPPKVHSAVIRLNRNKVTHLSCDEVLFKKVVKQSFLNRRKTLRNALKPLNLPSEIRDLPLLDLRAEQLDVGSFVDLTSRIEKWKNNHEI